MTENFNGHGVVRHGLDTRKFTKFCAFAEQKPADVQFSFAATGVAEERVLHTHASTGAYTLGGQRIDRQARRYSYHFGAHKEVEEALGVVQPTDREEVIEVALAALTGCINAVVSVSAAMRGIDLTGLQTEVRIDWNPAVFLHLRDVQENGVPTEQFGKLKVALTIVGDDLDATDVAFLQDTVARSAVFNLIALPHEHEIDVCVDTADRAPAAGASGRSD